MFYLNRFRADDSPQRLRWLVGLLVALVVAVAPDVRAGSIANWGNSHPNDSWIPTPTTPGHLAIAAGDDHAVALRFDGSLIVWGTIYSRAVARNPSRGDFSDPTPKGNDFTAIAAGRSHSLALRKDGSIVSWGDDHDGQVSKSPKDTDFIAIAAGKFHSVALRTNGTLVSWGDPSTNGPPADTTKFTAISASLQYSLALTTDGSIKYWGRPTSFYLYIGMPSETGYKAIAAGDQHALALRANGSIFSWGDDSAGQVSATPEGTDFVAISAGYNYSMALRSNGKIEVWGDVFFGQKTGAPSDAGFSAVAIAAGADYCLALTPSQGIDASRDLDWTAVDTYYQPDFLVQGAWSGKGAFAAESRLNAAPVGRGRAAYCLLNYDNASSVAPGQWQSGAWQVMQGINAIGPIQEKQIKFMAIDVEVEPPMGSKLTRDQVIAALPLDVDARVQRVAEAIQATLDRNLQPIIYSRRAYWSGLVKSTTAFQDFGLWDISLSSLGHNLAYDGQSLWQPYGGWNRRIGRQYALQLAADAGGKVDLDVFDPALFITPYTRPPVAVELSAIYAPGGPPDAVIRVSSTALTTLTVSRNPLKFRRQGIVTLQNTGTDPILGPLQLVVSNLTPGYTLWNASGNRDVEGPYMILPLAHEGLAPGATVSTRVCFEGTTTAVLNYTPRVFSGYWAAP